MVSISVLEVREFQRWKVNSHMGTLRAAIEGCEIQVMIDDDSTLSEELRDALVGVAEAMAAQQQADDAEVSGFARLNMGSLRMEPLKPVGTSAHSCWGYDAADDSCTWFSNGKDDPTPSSCSLYTRK